VKNKILVTTFAFSLSCLLSSFLANATVVEIRTNLGNFEVNLFDNTTPQTVENFLSYVNAGAYANNTVHRRDTDFVVQMGGFQYSNSFPPEAIATGTPVANEPVLSNVRGTLAMAKLPNSPNSATSQFYVNLKDNSSPLDTSNGGFTVFGQVLGNGMDIIEQIVGLPTFAYASPFNQLPLRNTNANFTTNNTPTDENIIIINDIVVTDAAVSTNTDLNPTINTQINSGGDEPPTSDSGGGSLGIVYLLGLTLLVAVRRRIFS
jgi:peptidyl-prolyl cis-trans isomerase A (cyclophilin A)